MKSIALIHTVKSLATSFDEKLRKSLKKDVKIYNLWDDFLAINPNEIGRFTVENRNRLLLDIKAQEMTGADLIVTTCSTLTPVVEMIRPLIQTPIIAIDDAMAKQCAELAGNVLVIATAESTLVPTVSKIRFEAEARNKRTDQPRPYTIETCLCREAFEALQHMDMETHDKLIKEKAWELKGYDCIVLAQASMAHLEKSIARITGCPTLSSPGLCIQEIKEKLEDLKS
ncbi:MAG TPA: aspartate/glutamate racemase family protein [Candidatus Enterocloster excrementigallinarum]|uniref:Aspartate/glutamate racemase family protein n=1 Tax=Candidatus Enterocloster excrementigallinarum TaxID=2838558 RepID=A0A9D2PWE3_9FIRM|nr:aspartate/glutamate racemase family protein [Candidatus Enterocloster excrementigallinarum]